MKEYKLIPLADRQYNVLLLFVASFLIFINFFNFQTITPVYLQEMGGTAFHSGLQSTVFFVTAVILRFYFGPLADRRGNKIALLIGTLGFAAAPFLLLFNQNIWYVILVRMIQSIGLAAYFSSASSMTSTLAPGNKVGLYIGLYRFVIMGALFVGPVSGLRLIDLYGYRLYHLLSMVLCLAAMLLVLVIKEQPKKIADNGNKIEPSSAKHMLVLIKDKKLYSIYMGTFILTIVYGLILTFSTLYIIQETTQNSGMFFTLVGFGSVAANMITGVISDRVGRVRVAYPCMIFMGVGTAILYYLPSCLFILYMGSVLIGFGYSGSIASLIAWNVDQADVELRTASLAVQESFSDLGMAAGSLLFGLIIQFIGMSLSYSVAGVVLVIYAIWKLFKVSRREDSDH